MRSENRSERLYFAFKFFRQFHAFDSTDCRRSDFSCDAKLSEFVAIFREGKEGHENTIRSQYCTDSNGTFAYDSLLRNCQAIAVYSCKSEEQKERSDFSEHALQCYASNNNSNSIFVRL
jgi:hypothetical protein